MAYVLGSNIYEILFLDELYIYQGQANQDCIPYKNDLIISSIKLDKLMEIPIKRNERSEIALKIIETGLQYLEYPIVSGNTIINPFEINIRDNVKSIPAMKFQLIERENPSIALDVRKLYFSVNSCGCIIKERLDQNKEINKYFCGKMVKCRYNDSQMLYKVKRVILNEEFNYKNESLQDHFKRKYKLKVNYDYILETDNSKSIKTQFLFADLCDLQYDFIEQDCTLYCQQLQYWNEIINASQNFLQFLKKFKLIIQGNTVDFKMQYLDSGTAIFANNVHKSFNQLVQARTQSEFTHFYGDFFLKQNVIFSTNLQIQNLIIFVQRDTIKDREQFRQFYDKFKFQILQKQYQINEAQIIDINNNLQELIQEYGKPENYIFLIGDQDFKEAKFQLLNLGVPNQIILLPVIDQEINRIFAIMAATKGSTPWQLKEIGGYLNNRRRAFLGIYQSGNVTNCVLSLNKSQTKYISAFGDLQECITLLIGTYYATHKHLPDIIVVFGYQQYNIEECLPISVNLIKQQYQIDILYPPELYKVIITEQLVIRYFTHYEKSIEARFCRNAGTGMIVNLNEKKGQYQLHTLRRGQGCPQALDIQIISCPQQLQREVIDSFYQLIYLCYDYNSQTYLPAPLHYAKLLSYYDHLDNNDKFKQEIQKGNLLFI